MLWVAIDDADTNEVTEFEPVTAEDVRCLMDDYRVDEHDVTRFRVQDVEDGHRVVYKGTIYKGGFGYNLWVANKYVEM